MSWQGPGGGRGGGRGGGGRGGGGGGYDRGGGGGGYGAGRGGGGGRGGGAGRGGRGGAAEPVKVFRDPNAALGAPDQRVTQIEDAYMKESKGPTALANLSVDGHFPARPAYGTQGKKIVVYANYHRIETPKSLSVTRYNIEVTPQAAGRKLARIIQLLFEKPELAGAVLATEFKALLLTLKPLSIPDPWTVQIPYVADGETDPTSHAVTYNVRLVTPTTLDIAELVSHLAARAPGVLSQSMAPQLEIIQGLNALLGFYPQASSCSSIASNRHYSLTPRNFMTLGGGLEALRGYYQSVRAATGGLLLNVNVVHNVFIEPIRLDLLYPKMGTGNLVTLQKKLKRVRFEVTHLPAKQSKAGTRIPRIKTCFGLAKPGDGAKDDYPPQISHFGAGPKDVKFWIADKPAKDSTKSKAEGKQAKGGKSASSALPTNQYISVLDYFKKAYPSIRLNEKYPVVNVGNTDNPSYLPADVCVVQAGQTIDRRLSPDQTAEMIKFACRKPWENAESIVTEGKTVLGLKPTAGSTLAKFGVSVGQALVTVNARVLMPPVIKYKNYQNKDHNLNPRFGSWNMADIKFHTGSNIGGWTYLHLKSDRYPGDRFSPQDLRSTVLRFGEFLSKSGINAGGLIRDKAAPVLTMRDGEEAHNDKTIRELFKLFRNSEKRPRFVLVVLPYADVALYNSIKTAGDLKAGVHTVCVVGSKFMKEQRQEQYFGNISLKFNLKAGGINQTLDPAKLGIISEGKTMVVGIDVTHPSPGSSDNAPSIAAIVASVDRVLGQWPGDFQKQDQARKEMVSSLEILFMGRLNTWQKYNKNLPENIVIYRDGVSEGQYQLLLEQELPLIRKACIQMYPPNGTKQGFPKISIIVCGKRHHTRFYPTTEANADRSANCEPGTCVDRGITETRKWDFFLQPHACLQGTARPCHYYVVLDEIFGKRPAKAPLQNPADTLEDLTHNMCYLFPRATKAVSLCPPAYLADLLCTRARCYLADLFDPNESAAASSVASGSTGQTDELKIPETLRNSMWYV